VGIHRVFNAPDDKIIFDVKEGQAVENGTQIAQVFKWGYQDETMQTLLGAQRDILSNQLSKIEGIVKPELEQITRSIDETLANIRLTLSGQTTADMLTLEQELKSLLQQRSEILKNDIQSDQTLDDLYEQEKLQLENWSSWKRDIINDAGRGLVSFYFDGYEQVLNTEKLDMVNADLIKNILRGVSTTSNITSETERTLYRLVNQNDWYIAFLTDASDPLRLVANEEYVVVFEGYYDQPYNAVAMEPIVSDNQIVNLLKFNQDMGALIGVRVAKATIKKDVSGLEIPLKAISVVDGVPQVKVNAGTQTVEVPIDVLAVNDQHAIIRSKEPNQLSAGQRYQK